MMCDRQAFVQFSHLHIPVTVLLVLTFLLSGILRYGCFFFTLAYGFLVVQSVGFVIYFVPV